MPSFVIHVVSQIAASTWPANSPNVTLLNRRSASFDLDQARFVAFESWYTLSNCKRSPNLRLFRERYCGLNPAYVNSMATVPQRLGAVGKAVTPGNQIESSMPIAYFDRLGVPRLS